METIMTDCNCACDSFTVPVHGVTMTVDTSGLTAETALDYDLEEQATGSIWLDGKAVYRKTVNVGPLPANASSETAHGITGLETLINIGGVATSSAGVNMPLPHAHNSAPVNVIVDAANVRVTTVYAGHADFSGHVTLLYTKTGG